MVNIHYLFVFVYVFFIGDPLNVILTPIWNQALKLVFVLFFFYIDKKEKKIVFVFLKVVVYSA